MCFFFFDSEGKFDGRKPDVWLVTSDGCRSARYNPSRARASAQTAAATSPHLFHTTFSQNPSASLTPFTPESPRESFPHPFPAFLKPRVDSRQVCRLTLNKHGGQWRRTAAIMVMMMVMSLFSSMLRSGPRDCEADGPSLYRTVFLRHLRVIYNSLYPPNLNHLLKNKKKKSIFSSRKKNVDKRYSSVKKEKGKYHQIE